MKILVILFLTTLIITVYGQVEPNQKPTDFLPKGFVVFEKIIGDLNNDNVDDCVLIIKGTDKRKIIKDEYHGRLDRNRRGIIVLFNKNGHYELAVKNYDCFSSENEDGGVYFAPELSVEIKHGVLYTHYGHGRYGYWRYKFRFQNSDFELIGYDESYRSNFESDGFAFNEVSINFLSKKKLTKEIIKVATDGKETYKETWKNISVNELFKLSKIKDFDKLDINLYLKKK